MKKPHPSQKDAELYKELQRQFGKDADMFILAPHKYLHHFDEKAKAAYERRQSL